MADPRCSLRNGRALPVPTCGGVTLASRMDDDAIIAMAGLGAAMATYAGISVTANTIRDAASIADKAGKSFISILNRMPLERVLDRLGIGIIPNADPHTAVKNYNWIIERKTGLGTQEIGAIGLALCAAAAIMWEMKHPYMGKGISQGMDMLTRAQEQQRLMIKELMPLLKDMTPTAQVEAIGKVIPSIATLIPLIA